MGGSGLGAKSTGKRPSSLGAGASPAAHGHDEKLAEPSKPVLDSPIADQDRSQTWQANWMGGSGLGAKSSGKRPSSLGAGASPAAHEKLAASPADFAQRATGLFASLAEPLLSNPVLDSPIADITPASDKPSTWVVSTGLGEGGIPTGSKRVRRTKAVDRDEDGVSDPGAEEEDEEEDEDAEERGSPVGGLGGRREAPLPNKAMEVCTPAVSVCCLICTTSHLSPRHSPPIGQQLHGRVHLCSLRALPPLKNFSRSHSIHSVAGGGLFSAPSRVVPAAAPISKPLSSHNAATCVAPDAAWS